MRYLIFVMGELGEKLIPLIGEQTALPISGILLCIIIFIVTVLLLYKLVKEERKIYWIIGIVWVSLTVGLAFIIGAIMNKPMEEMLSAYNIMTGNFWLLVVVFTGFVPWLSVKIRRII